MKLNVASICWVKLPGGLAVIVAAALIRFLTPTTPLNGILITQVQQLAESAFSHLQYKFIHFFQHGPSFSISY